MPTTDYAPCGEHSWGGRRVPLTFGGCGRPVHAKGHAVWGLVPGEAVVFCANCCPCSTLTELSVQPHHPEWVSA